MRTHRTARMLCSAAIIAVTLAATSPSALASIDDEANIAEIMVVKAVLHLDTEKNPAERIASLRTAIEAITVLEQLAAPSVNNAVAQQKLAELKRQTVLIDVLRLSLVEALSENITSKEGGLRFDIEAKSVTNDILDPAYRAAAWTHLARTHINLGQNNEAERLAMRAIKDARQIPRKQTRDGALRSSVLVFPLDSNASNIVEAATNAMTSANSRSEIYRLVALKQLGDEKKHPQSKLEQVAEQYLKNGDLDWSLRTTRAMERDEGARTAILLKNLDAALQGQKETLALQVIKSISRDKDHDKALNKLVKFRLDRDKPIRAQELLSLMLTDGGLIDGTIAVAKALNTQGYKTAALESLNTLQISPQNDPAGASSLANTFASLEAYDDAQRIAEAIIDPKRRSFAFSRISKRLADASKIAEAKAALANVTDAEDLVFARSGLARALVKAGNKDEAFELLKLLPDGPDRDRVLEELAKRASDAGDLIDARDYITKIASAEARGESIIYLAKALSVTNPKAAYQELKLAGQVISGLKEATPALADLIVAYVELGKTEIADSILNRIGASEFKNDVETRVLSTLLKLSAIETARSRLARLPESTRDQAKADIALSHYQQTGVIEDLVSSLNSLPFHVRVPALRAMSEARANTLDKPQWLKLPNIDPIASTSTSTVPLYANFSTNQYVIKAPVPSTRSLKGVTMPNIFELNASIMRSRVPAPSDSVASLALLGFSPFGFEAFKLTSNGTPTVYPAQVTQEESWPRYIAIEKGVVTLGNLLRDLPEAVSAGWLVDKGDTLLVRAPIIILPGATLVMSGAEFSQYQLGSQSGTYITVAGNLVVQDADIVGYDEVKHMPAYASESDKDAFRPFITAWSGSKLEIAGSRLAMLGYDASKAFGLTQSTGPAVQDLYATEHNAPSGNIVENSFENLRYGYYSYEASNVRLIGNEYRDNVVYGIDPHDRSNNLLIALNTAYGTHKKHGIIVSRQVNDSFIVGNVSLHNKGSGFMLDRTSQRNIVYANTGVSNDGDGLTLYESGCSITAANDFSRNKRAGIKIRNSSDVGVYDNIFEGNATNGADIYILDLQTAEDSQERDFEMDPFHLVTTSVLAGNLFAANGNAAINVDSASQTILEGNHFRDQRNMVYGGDFLQLSPHLLQLGEVAPTLIANGAACQKKAVPVCALDGWLYRKTQEMSCEGTAKSWRVGGEKEVKRNG
jgi:nitrous oxidase accessory protein NosD